MRGHLTRARICALVVAAGMAGAMTTAWLRPVEAQRPPARGAGPCVDEQEQRARARQAARAAEREVALAKAEARASKQQVLDKLEEVAAEQALVDAKLKRAAERRERLEKELGGRIIEERTW